MSGFDWWLRYGNRAACRFVRENTLAACRRLESRLLVYGELEMAAMVKCESQPGP